MLGHVYCLFLCGYLQVSRWGAVRDHETMPVGGKMGQDTLTDAIPRLRFDARWHARWRLNFGTALFVSARATIRRNHKFGGN